MTDLANLVTKNLPQVVNGHVATYIPALAEVEPEQLGIAVYNLDDGKISVAGDSETYFAIESISKVITLLYSIETLGLDFVNSVVGARQTGFSFDSNLNLEIEGGKKPLNPFVNSGAILMTSVIKDTEDKSAFEQILNFTKEICNDPLIKLNEEIFKSEQKTGDMNRSLAYYMKAKGILKADVEESLTTYFKQCSMMVTARSLANFGAVLANDGIKPWNNERIVSSSAATFTKSLMMTTGLYNASGIYSAKIGIPTKSGVGGGLVSSVPNKAGIGIFSPPLDEVGNSIAGLSLLEDVSKEYKWDIFC